MQAKLRIQIYFLKSMFLLLYEMSTGNCHNEDKTDNLVYRLYGIAEEERKIIVYDS